MLAATILTAAFLASATTTEPSATPAARNDAAVIEAILAKLPQTRSKFIAVAGTIETFSDNPRRPRGVPAEAFRGMLERSRAAAPLPAIGPSDLWRVLPSGDIEAAFNPTPPPGPQDLNWRWDAFYAKFPGCSGIARFSLPGYSRSGSSAIVWSTFGTGALAGEGGFYLLVRKAGVWVVKRYYGSWVA